MTREIANLQGYLKFEDNTTDSSTNGLTTTPTDITYDTGIQGKGVVFNGSSSKIVITESITGLKSLSFWANLGADNTDLIQLTASAKISIDSSGDITTTGLSNVTTKINGVAGTQLGTGTLNWVNLTFDSIDADAIIIGFETTYLDGLMDDLRFYSKTLTIEEERSIYRYGLGSPDNLFRVIAKETVNVLDAKLEKVNARAANKADINLSISTTVTDKDRVEYYNRNNRLMFVGNVDKIGTFGSKKLTVYDLSYKKTLVNNIYTGQSPEAIIEHLVNTYTDMTYTGSFSSGFTIDVQPFIDMPVMDAIKQMLDLIESDYRVSLTGTFQIEKTGSVAASFNININLTGANAILSEDGWIDDSEDKVSKIILVGDKVTYQKTNSFVATASQTDFITTYKPTGTMSVSQNGTELTPQEEGTSTGDYTRDDVNKTVTLTTGATVSDDIDILYDYQKDVRVEIEIDNQAGQDRLFTKKHIKTYQEGRKVARKLANFYGVTAKRGKLTIPAMDQFFNLEPNYTSTAKDTIRGVNQKITYEKVIYEFPNGGLTVEVGRPEYDLFDWSKETQQRIKDLEETNQNNEILQRYRYVLENIQLSVIELTVTRKTRTIGNSYVVNHPTNGVIGTTFQIGFQGSAWGPSE